ncbi:MAG: DUF4352 domain-containing protein [Eubacteriales bacterium]|nr:DUF4352 domain-containing protein [Eubacteriales bacterium]
MNENNLQNQAQNPGNIQYPGNNQNMGNYQNPGNNQPGGSGAYGNPVPGKTKVCKYCKTPMDISAKICPNCRKKQSHTVRWIVLGIIALIVIVSIAGGSSSNSKKVGTTGDGSVSSGDNNDSSNAGNTKDTYNVGDILQTDSLRISYVSVEDYVSDNMFIQPESGKKYIRAKFEFENIGKSDTFVSDMDYSCYADGYSCDQKYGFDGTLSATLSSGKKTNGYVYYEVPADATSIVIEYSDNYFSDKKISFVVK